MTVARACRPPTQGFCRRLAGRWWIAQYPPSVPSLWFACVTGPFAVPRSPYPTASGTRGDRALGNEGVVRVTPPLHTGK